MSLRLSCSDLWAISLVSSSAARAVARQWSSASFFGINQSQISGSALSCSADRCVLVPNPLIVGTVGWWGEVRTERSPCVAQASHLEAGPLAINVAVSRVLNSST